MENPGMGAIRKNNTRNRILHVIRTRERASKMDIKNITRYSMVTVLDTVDTLLAEGVVYQAEKAATKSGRRPTHLSINPDSGYFLGLSFHAREITLALLDFAGNRRDYRAEQIEAGQVSVEHVLQRIHALLRDMLEKHGQLRPRLMGIGVGAPGYVDESQGLCIFYSHIEGWENIPLKAWLEERFPDIPIYVENNSNAMALVYKWLLPQPPDATTAIISIRSGVRMSCIIHSLLHKGKNFTAGEIGHNRVSGGTRYCPCGKQGCLDTEVSDNAVCEKLLEGIRVGRFPEIWDMANQNPARVTLQLFLESARQGHQDSLALLDEICAYLGESIAQVLNILNPTKILINAKYCQLGDLFFDRLDKVVRQRAIFLALEGLTVEPVAFGEQISAIGAASIVMEHELAFVDAII